MTWNSANALGIFCTGNTAMKLARQIPNVLQVDMGWVLCPFPCNVLAIYQPGIPPLVPSGSREVTGGPSKSHPEGRGQ